MNTLYQRYERQCFRHCPKLEATCLSIDGAHEATLTLKPKTGVITAEDIDVPGGVTIHNPELYITTLKRCDFRHANCLKKGVGYRAVVIGEDRGDAEMIQVDAVFLTMRRIHYTVEATRVGQQTDLDKLHLEVKTNGSLTPEEAFKFASRVLESLLCNFQCRSKTHRARIHE